MLLFKLAQVISVHVKKKFDMTIKIKFTINMHTQKHNKICWQYKRISKSAPYFRTSLFLVKEINLILLKIGFIKFVKDQLCTQYLTVEVNSHSLMELSHS
jgi:hypothetical protein